MNGLTKIIKRNSLNESLNVSFALPQQRKFMFYIVHASGYADWDTTQNHQSSYQKLYGDFLLDPPLWSMLISDRPYRPQWPIPFLSISHTLNRNKYADFHWYPMQRWLFDRHLRFLFSMPTPSILHT